MPMDPLRMSQIREALDDDKKYYGQAFDIVKRNIRQNQQEASPAYVTLNQDDIKSIGEKINEMLPLLENKYISLDTLRRGASDESDSSEIAAVEDVIAAYNVVISVFLKPKQHQSDEGGTHDRCHAHGEVHCCPREALSEALDYLVEPSRN